MNTFQISNNKHEVIKLDAPGEYRIELVGEGAEVEIVGVFQTRDKENVDINLTIVHKAGRTRANTVLKGVAHDQSSIKFVGKIVIEPNCPVVNSFLTERILLLSPQARAEAIPELEIESDDVKCSHAATVSQIPEEEIFYLMSRGLTREVAQNLVVDGFLGRD